MHVDQRRDAEDAQDRLALGGDDLVDVAALRRQQQHAEHGAEALDRHRDRDDLLALLGDAHHGRRARRSARSSLRDRPRRCRRAAPGRPAGRCGGRSRATNFCTRSNEVRLLLVDRRQVVAQDLAARIEMARIEQQIGVAVVDAGARAGRRDQPPQHRRDALGIDREIEAVELVGARRRGSRRPAVRAAFPDRCVIESVSTVAEAAMAPAMISPCVIRLSTRASISPSRNWLR